jgi:uncharacterized protein (TIGR02302 family)
VLSPEQRHQGEILLENKLRWTKIAMALESLWLKLWAPIIVVSLFLIFTLFHVWPLLSPLMHRLALAIFALAFIASFYPLLSLRFPKESQALKRLDKNSTLPHQPAQAFKDKLEPSLSSQSHEQTHAIWLQFKNRLVEKIKGLKVRPPQPETYKQDPYALRMVLMLLVAIGVFFQSGKIKSLLAGAVTLPPLINTANMRIDAWVTPPSYTGKAPILIADGSKNATTTANNKKKKPVLVPQNSTLTIRINGGEAEKVEVESKNKTQKTKDKTLAANQKAKPVKTSDPKSTNKRTKEFHLKVTENGPVKLTIDTIPLKDWRFEIIPDSPPIIGLIEAPSAAASKTLKLKYRVVDDYGVISARAHIKGIYNENKKKSDLVNLNDENRPLGGPIDYALNISKQKTKSSEDTTFKDLTDHPWAGLPIKLHLSASDEGENTSNSPEINIVLPEYEFTKPLAKRIIGLRKQLILEPVKSPLVSDLLFTLLNDKAPFEKDFTLYLGIRMAASRLDSAKNRTEKEDLAKLLYQLARHAEDGDLSAAERELRTAQEELRKALQENASAEDIQKAIDKLKKALEKYMKALAKQQQNQNQNAQNQQNSSQQNMSQKDFEQMLKTIEELTKSGAKDLAKKMLNQLQNMLENLQAGKDQDQQQNNTSKAMQELSKILQKQQKLMDKTFEWSKKQKSKKAQQSEQPQQMGEHPKKPGELSHKPGEHPHKPGEHPHKPGEHPHKPNGAKQLKKEQEALRKQLQKILSELANTKQGEQNKGQQQGKGQQKKGQQGKGQQGQGQQGQGQQAQGKSGSGKKGKQTGGSPLDNANNAMQRAEEALNNNDLKSALSQEGQALDQLRKGIQQMAVQMQGKSSQGGAKKAGGKDPIGRPQSAKGMDTSDNTKVPDQIDIQRAREILRNLQNKLSDPNRPAPEIDYIERLLKRF